MDCSAAVSRAHALTGPSVARWPLPPGVKHEVSFRVSWISNVFAIDCGHVSRETSARGPYCLAKPPVSNLPPKAPGSTLAVIPSGASADTKAVSSVAAPRK